MPFRLKDLLSDFTTIDVDTPWLCGAFQSKEICVYVCSRIPSQIPCTIVCTKLGSHIPITETIIIDPTGMKNRLRVALAAAEAAEKVQAQIEQPQTLADAELLEKKLTEAIEEVRRQKAELQNQK